MGSEGVERLSKPCPGPANANRKSNISETSVNILAACIMVLNNNRITNTISNNLI